MSGLFRKTYFQTKVKKSGRCHNLKPGWAPQGNFLCNLSPSFYLNIMFTLTTWQNSHMEALYLWKNLCSWKFESRKKSLGRKKNRPKEEYHSVKKRKKSLVIKQLVLCYTLASRFQTSHHETKIYYTLSLTQGSFLFMQAPAMIWIHLQLPRIIILKALHQLVVLLLSTSGFSIFIGSF